jgi:hypothetical protein
MRTTIGFAFFAAALAALASGQERLPDGVSLKIGESRLEVRACREDVVRVAFAPPGPFDRRRRGPHHEAARRANRAAERRRDFPRP